MEREFDVIAVGAGTVGEAVATELAGSELTVAVIERDLVGGECPYWGCVPSKTLLRSAELVKEAARARDLAASRVELDIDFAKIAERTLVMARRLDDTNPAKAVEEHATLIRGEAHVLGPDGVEVDGRRLTARRGIVIGTGTSAAIPPIEGLDQIAYWTNREAVHAKQLPRSLIVLGGGAIGAELAQAFCRFGSRVTIVESAPRLAINEEPEVSDLLRRHLEADGITVKVGAKAKRVSAEGTGVRLELADGEVVNGERLLVATGRKANLDEVDLAASGLEKTDRGWLKVDPATLNAAERIWAGGDVTGIGNFTHLAHYHGTLIGRNLRGEQHAADHRAVPRVTFVDPEIASVGITEAQAREQGMRVGVVSSDAGNTARGYIHGFESGGLIKLVADAQKRRLVGASVVSPRAGEILSEMVLAIRADVPLDVLADSIMAFPTFSRQVQGEFDRLARQ
ncbi:MAG: FAD-dependent oxidoreductase [Candidatus Dormibacteraeota bacterium]|uniref:FAD-dependent oxidoreductase n=1 Tax=Candidatus Dormiibacter inghamiae TaxID=3127013 RepID=A0A934KJ96_9BACT|nr:FAD-dependent oxidoreductase [Candidatus Dormibacteraeota bacterium]MBJ7606922.1 FAD-dependent oxidoreductase [Candidatus Dormibacteraeota bacterium]